MHIQRNVFVVVPKGG